MDGHQLRCFLAIAELGSLTRAAGRLDIAQPTLSQILLRLEDELGVKLFERTARGVNLTDQGRIFQEHARIILRDMDRARAEVQRHDSRRPRDRRDRPSELDQQPGRRPPGGRGARAPPQRVGATRRGVLRAHPGVAGGRADRTGRPPPRGCAAPPVRAASCRRGLLPRRPAGPLRTARPPQHRGGPRLARRVPSPPPHHADTGPRAAAAGRAGGAGAGRGSWRWRSSSTR